MLNSRQARRCLHQGVGHCKRDGVDQSEHCGSPVKTAHNVRAGAYEFETGAVPLS
jgi:hypothetical protein